MTWILAIGRSYIAWLSRCASAVLAAASLFNPAQSLAAITWSGDVTPNPTTSTSSTSLYVAKTSNGTLTLNSGSALVSGSSRIGDSEGAVGSVTITGANSNWTHSGLTIGWYGNGDLKILAGGSVTASTARLGFDESGIGTATVSGQGSTWTLSRIEVGGSGSGTLTIADRGSIVANSASIGDFGGPGVAAVTGQGTNWSSTSSLYVGQHGPGTFEVKDGAMLTSGTTQIGVTDVGTMTVTGSQSSWTSSKDVTVGAGYDGTGTLNIFQNGHVSVDGDTAVRRHSASIGSINFTSGVLNTGGLLSNFSDLFGSGTINTHGLVSDVNLVFDATHGLQQQLIDSDTQGDNVVINIDANSTGSMGAGFEGQGSLTIKDGRQVQSRNGILGHHPGSTGVATIDGPGSLWSLSGNLTVGVNGAGRLAIRSSATVEVAETTKLGAGAGNTVTFENGVLTTKSLFAGLGQMLGTGTINTNGLVSDVNLRFDNTHLLQQQISLHNVSGQEVLINLNVDGNSSLGVGISGQSTLTIADGIDVTTKDGYLGYGTGSTGTAVVTGDGTSWTSSGQLFVGGEGTGNLTIENGADVMNDIALVKNGSIVVAGAGSSWTSSGHLSFNATNASGSNVELRILAGAQVTSAITSPTIFIPEVLFGSGIATQTGTTGAALVDGVGSKWTNGETLVVGAYGNGQLSITNGGGVISVGGYVGGNVIVSGAGSYWINTGKLTIGAVNSTLLISNGASVTATSGAVGSVFDSGSVTVSGAASLWSLSGGLQVGNSISEFTSSRVLVGSDARIEVGGELKLESSGDVVLDGGTIVANSIRFSATIYKGKFTWNAGTLHVGSFNGNLTNSGGILAPGTSPGKTTITGSYTQQSAATLAIEIGGPTATTQYDNVAVSGNTTLGGTLELSLINGFIPTAANTFTVLASTGTLTSSFANVANAERLLTTDGLGTFIVNYGAGSSFDVKQVVLSAFTITGDFNADGKVDAADYILWRRTNGTTVPRFTSADADGNGTINQADYTLWRTHFGRSAPAGSGAGSFENAAAIPEPSAVLLLFSCLLPFSHTRRRGRLNRN
jgi:T5SS/PEP-CTERM-associated repeat protein